MSRLLEIRNVSAGYGIARALDGVSAGVSEGQVLAILGPNGAGKSTLARVIAGLVPATSGQIQFDGIDITRWPAHRRRRLGLVSLPEQRAIFPSLTVLENLRMATCQLSEVPARTAELDRAYEMFPILGQRRNQLAGLLSGGEQQMLSLARTLAMRPRVIVADEVTHGLAPRLVGMAFGALAEAKAAGIAIVAIEQFVHRALNLADHCIIMQRGVVDWSGDATSAAGQVNESYLGSERARMVSQGHESTGAGSSGAT